MDVPSSVLRDLLAADWTIAFLPGPERSQPIPSFKVRVHLPAEPPVEVLVPFRIVWVRFRPDLDVARNRDVGGFDQPDSLFPAPYILHICRKNPSEVRFLKHHTYCGYSFLLEAFPLPVSVFDPSRSSFWVSPTGPGPKLFPDDVIYLPEGFLRHLVLVIVGPSAYYRIDLSYQVFLLCLFVGLDDSSDFP